MVERQDDVIDIARKCAKKWKRQGFSTTQVCCDRFLKIFDRRKLSLKSQVFLQTRWDYEMSLPLPKGKTGTPAPVGWQAMAHCYRWGNEAGVEGCGKITLIFITRKCGKTSFAASTALTTFKFSRNAMPFVYSLATKRDQATLTWRDGASMIKQKAREHGSKNSWQGFKALGQVIMYEPKDGRWETLPSEKDTLDGLQFELAILDEAAQIPDGIYDVVRSAMSNTVHGQHVFAISTAGKSANNWFSRMVYESIDRMKAGETIDINVLAWCVPEIEAGQKNVDQEYNPDVGVGDPTVWKKTHPSLGITITLDELKRHYEEAKLRPASMNEFRRTRLNEFTAKDVTSMCSVAIQRATANKSNDSIVEKMLSENICYLGVDISMRQDPTSVALSTLVDGKIYFKTRNWLCRQSYDLKISWNRTKILQDFMTAKYLMIAGSDMIDYEHVQAYITTVRDKYRIAAVYSDKATGGMTLRTFIKDDIGLPVLDFGAAHADRSIAKQYFLDKLYNLDLVSADNQMFRWEMDNAAVIELPDGKRDIVRLDTTVGGPLTIDGIYAVIHSIYPHAMRDWAMKASGMKAPKNADEVKANYGVGGPNTQKMSKSEELMMLQRESERKVDKLLTPSVGPPR